MADASAFAEYLAAGGSQTGFEQHLGWGSQLHVPELCDVEFVSSMRRLVRQRRLSGMQAEQLLIDYVELPIARHRHLPLLARMFELRENFAMTDASYVALAERLGGLLVTADRQLARAVRAHTDVEVAP